MDKTKAQHFLMNKEILSLEINQANLSKKDKVIEIGAGSGIITKELVKHSGKVLAFEIDKTLEKELKKIKNKNLTLVYDSALKYSWKNYNKIVSNIPYLLSEQTILKSIEDNIEELVIIVGEKFKEIILSNKTKIGIHTNLFYKVQPIKKVPKECFYPQPRVNSWLIKLTRKKDSTNNPLRFILLEKGKVKNSVISYFISQGKTKKQAKEILSKMSLNEQSLNKPVKKITANLLIRIEKDLEQISI